jgi:hypothetical protein
MSISMYRALVTIFPEMHLIEWDFFKETPFIVEKDPEILRLSGWAINQSRELATSIKSRNQHLFDARNITSQQGGMQTSQFQSTLHFQKSNADAQCVSALQLFEFLLDIEKRLESINETYKIKARKSKLTVAKDLYEVIDQLRKIVGLPGGDASKRTGDF